MKQLTTVVLILLALAVPAVADDFDALVKGIESRYGAHRMSPRLIGIASFLAKPAMWGSGVSGLKIAVFEDDNRTFASSVQEVDRIMLSSLTPKWRPFVRVDSRRDGESVVIYSTVEGKHVRMMIASVERHDISIVHIEVNPKAFSDWRTNPGGEAKNAAHPH